MLGFKFRRQHVIRGFIADFYCPEAHLVIEVDGPQHYTAQGLKADRRREDVMRKAGIATLRFTNDEILCKTSVSLAEIRKYLETRVLPDRFPSKNPQTFKTDKSIPVNTSEGNPQIHRCDGGKSFLSSNETKEPRRSTAVGNGMNLGKETGKVMQRIAKVAERKGGFPCTISPEELE